MSEYEKCGAKVGSGVCKRAAGWATEHFGAGRCKKHDLVPLSVPAPTPRLKELARQFKEDKDPFELREEIAACRAVFSQLIEEVDSGTDLLRVAPALNQIANTLGKLVQRLHEIEVGRQYVVHVDQVQRSLQQVLALVVQYVPEAKDRALLAEEIAGLVVPGSKAIEINSLTRTDTEVVHLLSGTIPQPDYSSSSSSDDPEVPE